MISISVCSVLTVLHHQGYVYDTVIRDYKSSMYHFKEAAMWASDEHLRSVALTYIALSERRQSSSPQALAKSISILQRAIEADPSNEVALLNIGYFYAELHENELSKQMFHRLLDINPQHILGNLNIGNYYFHRGEFSRAVEWYQRTLDVTKSTDTHSETLVMIYNNMGSGYRELGALERAMQAYMQAFSGTITSGALDAISACSNYHDETHRPPFRSSKNCSEYHSDSNISPLVNSLEELPVTLYGAWTLSNLLSMMGIMCQWHRLELFERIMGHVVARLAHVGPLGSSWDDNSEVDSYGFMLNRWVRRTKGGVIDR